MQPTSFRPSCGHSASCTRGTPPRATTVQDMPEDFQTAYATARSPHQNHDALQQLPHRFQQCRTFRRPYPQLIDPAFWNYNPQATPQPSIPQPNRFIDPLQCPLHSTATWHNDTQVFTINLHHLLHNSRLAVWLHSFGQLYNIQQGSISLNICSPILDLPNLAQGQAEMLYMHFDHNAFTMALTFLAQAHYTFPYTTMDPLQFLRALVYLQPYTFPIDIMVAMLRSVPVRTWAKLYVLTRTFFPRQTTLITLLENYNLWHVRIPMTRLRSVWMHAHTFQNVARSAHRLYLHATNRIHQGRCIICEFHIPIQELRSPTCFRNFYITPCCHYYAHFECWLRVSQTDYTCHICTQRYNSGHMSPLRAPPVVTPNSFGIYARMLADFRS